MSRLSVAVCEKDRIYGEKLTAWLSEREREKVVCCYFSDVNVFHDFYQKEPLDIILFGMGFAEEPWIVKEIEKEEKSSLWIFLMGKEQKACDGSIGIIPVAEKYQPASALSRKIFEEYQKYQCADESIYRGEAEIIGWYSPQGSVWQTPLALTMAAVLGKKEKVLYINLKECAGFSTWFQEEYKADILDLIYLVSENSGNFQNKVRSVVYTMEGFDYIPPALDSHLLNEAKSRDYEELLRVLQEQAGYDVILLDIGIMFPGFFQVLEKCSCIYISGEQNVLTSGSRKQYQELIKRQEYVELEEKMVWLEQPRMNQDILMPGCLMQQWLWGEPGNFIRRLLEGTGGRD